MALCQKPAGVNLHGFLNKKLADPELNGSK